MTPRTEAADLARRLAFAGTQARADAVIAEMCRKVEIAHAHPVARGVLRAELVALLPDLDAVLPSPALPPRRDDGCGELFGDYGVDAA